MINFGEWTPDQPDLASAGVTGAHNVVPAVRGYRCMKGIAAVSTAATGDILGMYAGKTDNGAASLYAGDTTKIYRLDQSDSSLVDKSKAGGYSTSSGNVWRFVQFGETLLATNFSDAIQTSTVGGSAIQMMSMVTNRTESGGLVSTIIPVGLLAQICQITRTS